MLLKAKFCMIPCHQLRANTYQPRKVFSEEELEELAQSIIRAGLLQPILVRPHNNSYNQFEIVAGERRWRAAQQAGLNELPCFVKPLTDKQAIEAATIENINRVNLNPLEEAQAYQRLIDEFGYLHEEVGAAVGKSRAGISNMLRLLRLDSSVQQLIIEGKIKEGHGRAIVSLPKEAQWPMAQKAMIQQWSVRQVERAVQDISQRPKEKKIVEDPNLMALNKALEEYMGTPVNVKYYASSGKGTLMIDFQNLQVLEGIFRKMNFDYNQLEK